MHKAEDHLRLVAKIASRYSKSTRADFDGLFQEGCIGLMSACEDYVEGDVPFGAFAGQRIQFAILCALLKSNHVYTSTSVVTNAIKIQKAKLETEPADVIAKKMNITVRAATRAVEHLNREIMSLDFKYADKSGKEMLFVDCVRAGSVDYESDVWFEQILVDLSPKEQLILTKVVEGYDYGLIADLVGLSFKSVRIYVGSIRKKMRERKYELLGIE